jgi:serine/threonine-protein kinase
MLLQQRYALRARLRSTGAYDVYAASDTGGAPRWVEVLTAVRAMGPAGVRVFASAIAGVSVVTHASLAPPLGCGVTADGNPFVVSEDLGGELLSTRLASGPLPAADAVDLCGQLLAGLDAAHEKNLAHLDVDTARVLLLNERGKAPRIKLLALGTTSALVEAHRCGALAWAPGKSWGDTRHFAPERAVGDHVLTWRDDLWSAAVLLYEVLTGVLPFEGTNPQELVAQIIGRWQEPPSVVNTKVPHELDPILFQALHKDPTARYKSAADFRTALLGAWAKHRFVGIKNASSRDTAAGTMPRAPARASDQAQGEPPLFSVPIFRSPDIPEDVTPTSQRFRVLEDAPKPPKR